MKKILLLTLCAFALVFTACEYDNYDEPSSHFHGRILYNGEPLGFGYNECYIELWEQGDWALKAAIRVNVNIDGTFSHVLFDGDYKMVIPSSVRPFKMEQDTVLVQLRGDQQMDLNVTPYFTIENVQYRYNESNDKLECSCAIKKVPNASGTADVEIMREYVGKTMYLYTGSHINYHTLNQSNNPGKSLDNVLWTGPVVNRAKLPASQDYVFARVGYKLKGITPMIMTHPIQVKVR